MGRKVTVSGRAGGVPAGGKVATALACGVVPHPLRPLPGLPVSSSLHHPACEYGNATCFQLHLVT